MPHRKPKTAYRLISSRRGGFVAALGLHIAVLAAIVIVSEQIPDTPESDGGQVHYIDLYSEVDGFARTERTDDSTTQDNDASQTPEPEPEPKPEPEPELAIEPEPTLRPAPKPTPAPEPTPQVPATKKRVATKPATPPLPPSASDSTAGGRTSTDATPDATTDAPGDADQPRHISSVDYLGQPPRPVYPHASLRRREQGRVVVQVLISASGTVTTASVARSSGYERLDNAALSAVKQARFKPYTENGVAYPALANIPIDFAL